MKNSLTNANKALWDAKKIIAQIITDVVNLEDINYTVPEVQTLLDGITVGGHKIQDELITLNQANAWNFLFASIENNTFAVNKEFVLQLHALVAKGEALKWGEFRSGGVSISGTSYVPSQALLLDDLWGKLELETKKLLQKDNIPEKMRLYKAATNLFAKMARTQFFFDGNKRTGRMMMSGLLLANYQPMINVPATRKLEFNKVMINYYNTEEFGPAYQFLISCLDEWVVKEYKLEDIYGSKVQ